MQYSIDCIMIMNDMDRLIKQLNFKINCETVPEIKVEILPENEVIKNEIEQKIQIKVNITKNEIEEKEKEVACPLKVKKVAKTAAERQRDRRARLKAAKTSENDDMSISSSDNNIITCECGCTLNKSYFNRHMKSRNHIEKIEKIKLEEYENKKELENKEDDNLLKIAKNYINKFSNNNLIYENENNNNLFSELYRYINQFISDRINQKQLDKYCIYEIKDFMDAENIEYDEYIFEEYNYETDEDEDEDEE